MRTVDVFALDTEPHHEYSIQFFRQNQVAIPLLITNAAGDEIASTNGTGLSFRSEVGGRVFAVIDEVARYRNLDYELLVESFRLDVSGDGAFSGSDIDALFAAVGTGDEQFDLNEDGRVSRRDADYFLERARRLPGDTNLDGDIDVRDFLSLSRSFGSGESWSDGDFTGDRQVNVADFLALSRNFNAPTPPALVEEIPDPFDRDLVPLGETRTQNVGTNLAFKLDVKAGDLLELSFDFSNADARGNLSIFDPERETRLFEQPWRRELVVPGWRAPLTGRVIVELQNFGRRVRTTYGADFAEPVSQRFDDVPVLSAEPRPESIAFPGDRDWFRFDTHEGMVYEVVAAARQEPFDLTMIVVDNDRTTELATDLTGEAARTRFTATATGRHYVSIGGVANSTGDYLVHVHEFPAAVSIEPEVGDAALSLGAPNSIAPVSFTSVLSAATETDNYSFRAVPGTHWYEFEVRPIGFTDSFVRLQTTDSESTLLAFDDDSADGLGSRLRWRPEETGIYELTVGSNRGWGEYELVVSLIADDHADVFSESVQPISEAGVVGQLQSSDDRDVFRFETNSSAPWYRFDVTGLESGHSPRISVFRTDGTPVRFSDSGSVAIGNAEFEYVIAVESAGGNGAYRLAVEAVHDPEPNLPTGDARTIMYGEQVEGVLDVDIDVDVFGIDLEAGDRILVEHPTVHFALLTADGSQLAAGERISWRTPTTGRYFVSVSGPEAGNYTFSVPIFAGDEPDFFTDPPIVIEDVPPEFRIAGPDDLDVFAIDVDVPSGLHIQTSSSVSYRLLDEAGAEVAGEGNTWLDLQPGRYFIEASADRPRSTTLRYRLFVDDHGDTNENATVLESLEQTEATIESPVDTDVFAFDATAGAKLRVEMNPGNEFTVTSPNGTEFAARSTWARTAEESGRYFVRRTEVVGDYMIRAIFEDDHPDDASTDLPLLDHGVVSPNRFEQFQDVDVFRIQGEADDILRIDLYTSSSQRRAEIDLLAADGTTSIASCFCTSLTAQLAETSDYFVRAIDVLRISEYAIQTTVLGSAMGLPADVPTSSETLYGFVPTVLGVDLERDHSVDVRVTGTEIPVSVEVASGEGEFVARGESFRPARTGRHYLLLRSSQPTTFNVELVTVDDFDQLLNSNATELMRGVPLSGSIERRDDVDVFRFTAGMEGEYIWFSDSFDSSNALTIYDSGGQWLGEAYRSWTAPAEGTYFLEVRSPDREPQDYTLTLRTLEDDFPNSIVDRPITTIPLDTRIEAVTETGEDRDVFAFELPTTSSVGVRQLTGAPIVSATIYKEDGTPVLAPWRPQLIWPNLQPGRYFVEISGAGEFAFDINVADDHQNVAHPDATRVQAGRTITGLFERGRDVDVFAIEVPENSPGYVITTEGDQLSAPAIETLPGTPEAEKVLRWKPEPGLAFFYVRVRGGNPVDLEYQLKVSLSEDDHPDAPQDGLTVLQPNAIVSGGIETGGDRDVYAVDVTEGVYMSAAASGIRDAHRRYGLRVLDSTGNELVASDGSSNNVVWLPQESGQQFVEITRATTYSDWDRPDYRIGVSPPMVAEINARTEGSLDMPFDVNLITVDVPAGTNLTASTSTELRNGTRLREVGSNEHFQSRFFAEAQQLVLRVDANRDFPSQTGSYVIRLSAPRDDYANVLTESTRELSGTGQLTGFIGVIGDVDVFSFDVTTNTGVNLTFDWPDLPDATITVVTPSGNTIEGDASAGVYGLSSMFAEPGIHEVRITGDVPTQYHLNWDLSVDDRPNLPYADATALIVGQTRHTVIDSDDDVDVFAFEVRPNRTYQLIAYIRRFNPGLPTIRILSEEGNQVSRIQMRDHRSFTHSAILNLAPGTWYLEISGASLGGVDLVLTEVVQSG